jgi:3-phenylpropionate/trans-cinnamate dioxygenase ferredoxin component
MAFTRACALADLAPDAPVATTIDDVAVAVVLHDDDVYAIHDECSHAAIPLSEGEVDGCEIECWLHGSRFDLRTGKPSGPPATDRVPTYPVRVEGDDVLVDVTSPLNDA